jgi:multidrug efflux pump subunit AcrA (membrane-fusion protein)
MQTMTAKRTGTLMCALVIAIALAACGGGKSRRHRAGAEGPQAVPVATAAAAVVKPTVQIAGIVAPYQNVSISSSLSEPTDSVNVIQGDDVRKGQVLAVLDTADLRASFQAADRTAASDDARAAQTKYQADLNIGQGGDQVSNARAALVQARVSLLQAQRDLVRYRDLESSGYVSDQQYQQQETLVHNDEAQVLSSQASLESAILNAKINGTQQRGLQASTVTSAIADAQSAHAQAAEIQTQIDKAQIVSPVDGVVINRNLNPGEYPGSRTIFTIQQLNPVYAELNASSSDVFRIQRGATVQVAVAGIPDATYPGKVSSVLGQVEPGSTNFTVETILANPGERLKSGMAVTGTIALPTVKGIGIPATAFLDDSHSSVMIVASDGTAKQQSVHERATDGKTSIVTGVLPGTRVISNGQLGITAGQQIDPTPSPAGSAAPTTK